MPRTPLHRRQGKKHLQQSANLDLDHLGALLPPMELHLSPRILMVAMHQILRGKGSSCDVIVFSRCHFTTLYELCSYHHCIGILMYRNANARHFTT